MHPQLPQRTPRVSRVAVTPVASPPITELARIAAALRSWAQEPKRSIGTENEGCAA